MRISAMLGEVDVTGTEGHGEEHGKRRGWDHSEVWENELMPEFMRLRERCRDLGIPFVMAAVPVVKRSGLNMQAFLEMTPDNHICELAAAFELIKLPHAMSHFLLFMGMGRAALRGAPPAQPPRPDRAMDHGVDVR